MNTFKNRFYTLVKYLIGWPLSFISLIFVVNIIYGNKGSLLAIKYLNPVLLLLSVLCFLVYFVLRALLWQEIIKGKGSNFPFKKSLYFWELSEIKRYTPGNIWSFLSRSSLFTKNNLSAKDVFSSLTIEIGLIILGCFTLSLFYISYIFKNLYINILLIFFLLFILIFYTFLYKIQLNRLLDKLKKAILPGKDPVYNLRLYLISLAAFFMFGLATYFAAVSVFYLDLRYIVQFVSLFVFSLLVGYLSIVTPMGLGVREGTMTLGLAFFLPVSSAGIISIFSRVIFIVSEVMFLFLTYLWINIKNKIVNRLETYILNHKHEVILLFCVCLYILYFTAASFLKYNNFYNGRFDLGNMDQTVWNTIHGRIFQMTDPNGTNIISRLAFHADFILILISPLYLIWSDPRMLLLLQTLILSFGSIVIYKIANEILKNKNFSLSLSVAFLLNPAIQYTNLYDFHPVTLATAFLLITFYFFLKKRYLLFLLFALLSGLTKEQVWSIISVFGLAIVIRSLYERKNYKNYREILFGFSVFILSVFVFYELIWKIIPYFNGGNHFALSYYSYFGSSASQIVKNILLNPIKDLSIVTHTGNLIYLAELFAPLGFLPLLSAQFLIFAAPDFVINLLSNNSQLHQIYYQYTATITPFLFISTIYSAKAIITKTKISFDQLSFYIIFFAFTGAYLVGPLPGALKPSIAMFTKQLPYSNTVDDFLKSIPRKYSIAATNNLGSHLSRRQNIYTIPLGINKADVILFLLNDAFAQPSLPAQKKMVQQMREDKNYIQVFYKEDFIVFEKRDLYTKPKSKPKKGQVKLFPYSINALSHRSYTPSEIKIEKEVKGGISYKSYIISYRSDGLKLYSLMNVPTTNKPFGGFPVVVLDHGYIIPNQYNTVTSYKSVADYFSSKGFLVLKPDYRGNGKSEIADKALMRFAYPIDVLNLLVSIKNIPDANKNEIFLWSHSMGGEVTLEVLEVIPNIKELSSSVQAAAFWAPVTDPLKWFSKQNLPNLPEAKISPYPYAKTFQILGTPEKNPELWLSISPLTYLSNIQTPVLLQHGTKDTTVPYSWSVELYNDLRSLNKNAQLLSYPGDSHNLPLDFSQALDADYNYFKQFIL